MPKLRSKKSSAPVPPAVPAAAAPADRATELAAKIRELIHLAKEQGHLTFDDISEALPESLSTPEGLDEILAKLREL